MRAATSLFSVLLLLPWFTGCSTGPSGDGPTGSPSAAAPARASSGGMQEEAVRDLRKQMTAAEVRAAWGKPAKIVLMDSAEGQAEVWTYEKSYVSGVREVQTSFTTYTRQNPITGQDETLSEPVYSLEQIVVDETIELLFFDSRLLEWKRSAETARKYQ